MNREGWPVNRSDPCGRPTKIGTPCSAGRGAMTVYVGFDTVVWESPACKKHLTPEEHAARQEVEDRISGIQAGAEPACWSWALPPAPEDLIRTFLEQPGLDAELVRPYVFGDILAFEEFHDGRCAICGVTGDHLVEDHDHSTGMIRGKLCRRCNVQEGVSNHPLFWKYRARNPASILGVQLSYTGIGWVDGVPVGGWAAYRRREGRRGPETDESVWIDNAVNYLNL